MKKSAGIGIDSEYVLFCWATPSTVYNRFVCIWNWATPLTGTPGSMSMSLTPVTVMDLPLSPGTAMDAPCTPGSTSLPPSMAIDVPCPPETTSLSPGMSMDACCTPGLTSLSPGTSMDACCTPGSTSFPPSTSMIAHHTPGCMSIPSSVVHTLWSSPACGSAGSLPQEHSGELRYISKYSVQFVPAPTTKAKISAAKQVSGARVLGSAKCAAIFQER